MTIFYSPMVVALFGYLEDEEKEEIRTVQIEDMLTLLTERQREVLKTRYRGEPGRVLSVSETARRLCTAPQNVMQIERQAINRIRRKTSN